MQETLRRAHAGEQFSARLFAGDWQGARTLAFRELAEGDDRGERLRWLSNVAFAEWAGGDYETALSVCEGAQSLYRSIQSASLRGIYENARGCALEYLDRLDESLTFYRLSFNSFRAAADKERMAALANNIGHVLTKLGEAADALNHLKLAESLYEELGDKARLVDVADSILKARRLAAGRD
jgi:tetratricopeptide (TPR) repeat protein